MREGPWCGAVSDVEESVARESGAGRADTCWGHCRLVPGCAAISGRKEVWTAHERNANIDGLVARPDCLRAAMGTNLTNTMPLPLTGIDASAARAFRRGWARAEGNGFLDIGKAGDWRPGCAAIVERHRPSWRVPRYRMWPSRINRKALAIAAPIFVAAEFEWHVGPLKALALVIGAEDGAVGRTRVGVSSARQVDPIGIGWIHRDGLDSHQVEVLVGHPIQNRLPAMRGASQR
jgi:hypothetical protein